MPKQKRPVVVSDLKPCFSPPGLRSTIETLSRNAHRGKFITPVKNTRYVGSSCVFGWVPKMHRRYRCSCSVEASRVVSSYAQSRDVICEEEILAVCTPQPTTTRFYLRPVNNRPTQGPQMAVGHDASARQKLRGRGSSSPGRSLPREIPSRRASRTIKIACVRFSAG